MCKLLSSNFQEKTPSLHPYKLPPKPTLSRVQKMRVHFPHASRTPVLGPLACLRLAMRVVAAIVVEDGLQHVEYWCQTLSNVPLFSSKVAIVAALAMPEIAILLNLQRADLHRAKA